MAYGISLVVALDLASFIRGSSLKVSVELLKKKMLIKCKKKGLPGFIAFSNVQTTQALSWYT